MVAEPHVSEKRTLERLLEALQELPYVRAETPNYEMQDGKGHHRIDAEIVVHVGGNRIVLLVEVKKSVYPRDAQQVLWQLSRYLATERNQGEIVVPFLAAESISQGAKDLLKKEHFGYFDTGGSLFIPALSAYFYVEKPPPRTLEKSIRGLFRGKRAQVLHTLLVRHDEWFGVKELSEQAKVSSGTASETLSALQRFEWVESRGKGPSKERRLIEPGALLDEWKNQVLASSRGMSYRRYYVPGLRTEELAERLGIVCERLHVEYVLTQEIAAQFYAPFLSTISRVSCRIAPGQAADEAVSKLEARVVTEGANLNVIETRSKGEFLFKERRDSAWLASPIQVYLDLMRGDGRAKEMAEHLRQERIGF